MELQCANKVSTIPLAQKRGLGQKWGIEEKLCSKPSYLDRRSEFSGCILSAGPHCLVLTVGIFGCCTGARIASCDWEKEEKFLISI